MLPGGPWVVPGRSPDAPWAAFSAPMAIYKTLCFIIFSRIARAVGPLEITREAFGEFLQGPCGVCGRSWGSLKCPRGVLKESLGGFWKVFGGPCGVLGVSSKVKIC